MTMRAIDGPDEMAGHLSEMWASFTALSDVAPYATRRDQAMVDNHIQHFRFHAERLSRQIAEAKEAAREKS